MDGWMIDSWIKTFFSKLFIHLDKRVSKKKNEWMDK